MVTLLMGLLGAMLAALGGWLLWQAMLPSSRDPVQRLYLRFCARLARRGLTRKASEGPLDFAARACARYPELAGQIDEIVRQYVELRYRAANRAALAGLAVAVSRFRP
jgi:hypothetical protein